METQDDEILMIHPEEMKLEVISAARQEDAEMREDDGADRKITDDRGQMQLNLDGLRADRIISGGMGSSIDEQMTPNAPMVSKTYRSESLGNEDLRAPFSSRNQSLRTGRIMRSESLFVPPKISDSLIEKTTKLHRGAPASNFDHSLNLK